MEVTLAYLQADATYPESRDFLNIFSNGSLTVFLHCFSTLVYISSGFGDSNFFNRSVSLINVSLLITTSVNLTASPSLSIWSHSASNYGLGAVLFQYHDDRPHLISYASRKLLDRERRYSTIERECLAIVFGIHRFDFYLRGEEFILEVDHKPLIYLEKFKGKNDSTTLGFRSSTL